MLTSRFDLLATMRSTTLQSPTAGFGAGRNGRRFARTHPAIRAPLDRLLGGDPRPEAARGRAAIPRQRVATGSLRLSSRGRRAAPFPGRSGLRRVVDLTVDGRRHVGSPTRGCERPTLPAARSTPLRASRSFVPIPFRAAVISMRPQISSSRDSQEWFACKPARARLRAHAVLGEGQLNCGRELCCAAGDVDMRLVVTCCGKRGRNDGFSGRQVLEDLERAHRLRVLVDEKWNRAHVHGFQELGKPIPVRRAKKVDVLEPLKLTDVEASQDRADEDERPFRMGVSDESDELSVEALVDLSDEADDRSPDRAATWLRPGLRMRGSGEDDRRRPRVEHSGCSS